MKEYNKLVRDNIPEIMIKNGAKQLLEFYQIRSIWKN